MPAAAMDFPVSSIDSPNDYCFLDFQVSSPINSDGNSSRSSTGRVLFV